MVTLRFLITMLLITTCQFVLAEVSATVNRDSIGFNETVTLTITTDDSSVNDFDSSSLEKQFDILSTNSSSQRTNINFKSSFVKTWQLTLSPKTTGTLKIGPFKIGKETTQALTVKVTEATNGLVNGQAQGLFLEVSTDKQNYYTQEQIIVTIKLNDSLGLQNLQLSPLKIDNSFIEELQQSQYQRKLHGKLYNTYEVRYAVFSQASGQLTIPSVLAHGVQISSTRQRSSLFSQSYSQPVRSKSQPLTIAINPPPKTSSKPWLPAKNLTITESFNQAPNNLKVGDSLTRTITISAEGLSHEQLPTLPEINLDGIKVYQEVSKQENQASDKNITSTKVIQQTLVFTKANEYTLPETTIEWYDTQQQQSRTATLKGIELSIAANPELASSHSPITSTTTNEAATQAADKPTSKATNTTLEKPGHNQQLWLWQVACLLLAVLSIGLALALRSHKNQHRTEQKSSNHSDPFKEAAQALQLACKNKDVKATQKALKKLAKLSNPGVKIYSLADVQRAFPNESLQQFIIDLDKASVNKSHNVNWLLAKECVALFQKGQHKKPVLPTLYPQ